MRERAIQTKLDKSPMASLFSRFKAPCKPKQTDTPVVAKNKTVDRTTTTSMPTTLKPILREYKLNTGLHEGALWTQLQEDYKKLKKPVAARITISESTASIIHHYYVCGEGGLKPLKTIREIVRACPLPGYLTSGVRKMKQELAEIDITLLLQVHISEIPTY